MVHCCVRWQPYYDAFMRRSHRSSMSTASLDSCLFCVMLLLLPQTQFINGRKHQEGTVVPFTRRQVAEVVRVVRSCLLALLQRVCRKSSTVDGCDVGDPLRRFRIRWG